DSVDLRRALKRAHLPARCGPCLRLRPDQACCWSIVRDIAVLPARWASPSQVAAEVRCLRRMFARASRPAAARPLAAYERYGLVRSFCLTPIDGSPGRGSTLGLSAAGAHDRACDDAYVGAAHDVFNEAKCPVQPVLGSGEGAPFSASRND